MPFPVYKEKKLVLLDSDTFSKMSKVLMFKNKDRNVIDSASFEMIIKDNILEVLPSKVNVDRYEIALGGTSTLDMAYNFQVSVLKSPMPFKAGIDIVGDVADYDIKVTKAKYKYLFSEKERQQMKVDSAIVKKKRAVINGLSF